MVEILLTHGADPNFTDPNGNTALHFAALLVREEIALQLLKNGASEDVRNNAGKSPLLWALSIPDATELADIEGSYKPRDNSERELVAWLLEMPRTGRVGLLLLESGADPNLADNHGTSPLMLAEENGLAEVRTALIARGANPTPRARATREQDQPYKPTDEQMLVDEAYCTMKAQKWLTAGAGMAARSAGWGLIGLWAHNNAYDGCMKKRRRAREAEGARRQSLVSSGPHQQAPIPRATERETPLPNGEAYIPPVEWCHQSCLEDHSGWCRLCDENYTGWREQPSQPEFEIVPLQWNEKK